MKIMSPEITINICMWILKVFSQLITLYEYKLFISIFYIHKMQSYELL